MKKSKRILSLLTALAITASSFAAMVIPASAADDGATLYSQNYEAEDATADWKSANEERYTPILLTDSTAGINKYLTVTQSERSNNGTTVSSPEIGVTANRFAVEFDIKLGSSADTFAHFDVQDSEGNAFFELKQTAKNGSTWEINGNSDYDLAMPKAGNVRAGTEVDLENLGWYHFLIQYADGTMYVTTKDKVADTYVKYNGEADVNKILIPPATQAGGVKKMVFNTGKTTSDFAIDNIVVRNLNENEVPEAKFYNLTINTTRYAKMVYTRSDKSEDGEKTLFADAAGKIEIPLIAGDATVTYTLSKTGYTAPSTAVDATVTMTEAKTIEAPLTANDDISDYIYYESDFGNANGNISIGREANVALGDIELPDIAEISFDLNVTAVEVSHVTMAFFNADSSGIANKNDVFGIQGNEDGVFLFADYNGTSSSTVQQGWQQYDAVGKFESSVKIADSYVGSNKVKLVVDKNKKTVTATFGDNDPQVLSFTKDASVLKYLKLAKHNEAATATIDNIIVKEPDPNYVLVNGDTSFAKIAGKTVTRQFTNTPAVYLEDEEFAWTAIDASTGEAVTGVTIDDNGLLSVEDTVAVPATLKIEAVSKTTAAKKGDITVTINDYATLTPTIEGPKAIETGEKATYKITKITDNYDDDVTEYFTPVWTINGANTDTYVTFTGLTPGKATAISATYNGTALESLFTEEVTIPSNGELTYSTTAAAKVMLWDTLDGMKPLSTEVKTAPAATTVDEETTVATVGGKSGEVTTYNDGNFTLTVTLAAGQTATYPVKVDKYYIIDDYDNQTTYSVEDLVEDTAITGYLVTLSDANKAKIAEQVTEAATAQATGAVVPAVPADKTAVELEVAPVFTTTVGSELLIPDETYNITLNTNSGGRSDVYVNNQIIVNNINQDSQNFTVKGSFPAAAYKFGDIEIAEGYAKFWYTDNQGSNTPVDSVVVSKAPTIVDRATRFYVIGDSLVATYHDHLGVEVDKANLVRQGWGEAFKDYIKDAEVTNLGNSGAQSHEMLANAFTQVRASGKAGDILVLESGYNDKSTAIMKEAIKQMVIEAEQKGITVFVVPPNASTHSENEYKGNVKAHSSVKDAVKELQNVGYHPILIDLSTNSASFFERNYGAYATVNADSAKWNNIRDTYNNSGDTLHSTNNAANAWAAIVAKGVYDNEATRKYVDTEHNFTITDANDATHSIVVNVLTVNGTN